MMLATSHSQDSENLPNLDVIAQEIVEDLQDALAQFAEIAADFKRFAASLGG